MFYILDKIPLSDMSCAKIFSLYDVYLLSLDIALHRKSLDLTKPNLSLISFMDCTFRVVFTSHHLTQGH